MTRPSAVVDVILLVVAATAMVTTAGPALTIGPVQECLPCADLFSKLEAGPDGRLSQVVEMQLRGEPKSGTTMSSIRAMDILKSTCGLLGSLYGARTCTISTTDKVTQLLFNPQLSPAGSRCSCDTIDRVSISLDLKEKHTLPVEESCPWSHPNWIWRGTEVCRTRDDGEIRSYADLLSCVEEAECEPTDTRLQFATLRDPRPMTVSAYFHRKEHSNGQMGMTVDEYVWENLAWTCQWIALRYYLFEGVLARRSSVFWHEDADADPVGWHLQWLDFAGLQLPMTVVDSMAQAAMAESLKSINAHPGGEKASASRTWVDEVGADVVEGADEILRAFLPPVLLARWGVTH